MKLPRVHCEKCDRPIAAGPVAGRLSKGRLWRHDPPNMRELHPGELVSCAGSLAIVDLPVGQMELVSDDDLERASEPDDEQPGLF
ncbi:hypothetical protein ACPCSP_25470 [Streptomyces cinereoruber]|uniref:hypothetical protein n=1 Tax=Streptomyces cinereoruber TaxID=67260 RepID=UPI003C2C0146